VLGGVTRTILVGEEHDEENYDALFGVWVTRGLAAQTISGTLDLCTGRWATLDGANGKLKVHAYITDGDTLEVKHTLINEYVDTSLFDLGTGTFRQLQIALTTGNAAEGDHVALELGVRMVDNNPSDLYDTTFYLIMGTTDSGETPLTDATNGDTTSRAPWVEFSSALEELAASTPPANDACTDATVIASAPYWSDPVDSSTSTDPDNKCGVWWTYVAEQTGRLFVHTFGSWYRTKIWVYTGSSCAGLSVATTSDRTAWMQLAQSIGSLQVTQGTTYWFKVDSNSAGPYNPAKTGGDTRFGLFYYAAPQADDLFVDCQHITCWRDGQLINCQSGLYGYTPTGNAIDYTERVLLDWNEAPHSAHRLYVTIFAASSYVEILDLATLGVGQSTSDLNYLYDAFNPVSGKSNYASSIVFMASGDILLGFFGNNYDHIGIPATGTTYYPRQTTGVPGDSPDYNNPDATAYDVALEQSGSDFVEVAKDQTTIWYTSAGRKILRYNLATESQLSDFVDLDYEAKYRPGLRSLRLLPPGDGTTGLLVCDGDHVKRLDADGDVIQTYYPSATRRAQDLDKVEITQDRTAFWVSDQLSTSLFKFDLETGAQLDDVRTYLPPGQLCGFSVYFGYRAGLAENYGDVETPPPVVEGEGGVSGSGTDMSAAHMVYRIRRQRRTQHLTADGLWTFYQRFQLDLEAGVGLNDGQGEDPQLMLRWSDDGGHTWSDEHWVTAGRLGEYARRAIWRRLGRSRDRVFEVTISDPVKVAWLGAWLDVEPGRH
jgi:hypothetical protein